jgi:hypothetical protein
VIILSTMMGQAIRDGVNMNVMYVPIVVQISVGGHCFALCMVM